MESAENGGGQHPAPEGRQIGTTTPWDVYDTFPYFEGGGCQASLGIFPLLFFLLTHSLIICVRSCVLDFKDHHKIFQIVVNN